MNIAGLRGMGSRFFRYVRDPHVALWRKLAGVLAVVYFLSPVDALPDFMPVLGWLDDLGVLSAAAFFMVREVQRHQVVLSGDDAQAGVPSPARKTI
ncbi:YkvA family protein [Myxococcus sp. Y35]|uniref:YkvA family protein n=1 Tax=Pseudomyxococcus flavus TaxID=3115648 RepID=UPI003CEEFC37